METNKEKPSFFVRLATWIVDKRNLFFLIYIVALLFCLVAKGWVSINNEVTDYLSEDTETRQGLDIMEDQFITLGTARVMVKNIPFERALQLADELEEIEGVSTVDFGDEDNADDRAAHYRHSAALYDVTFEGEEKEAISLSAKAALLDTLAAYDVYIDTEVGVDDSVTLAEEMKSILVVAAIIIVVVLLITSKTYGEIPVLLLTFSTAMLLNMGTNFVFGEISYISNSIAPVLQLALAIDYAIILCHRFSEERAAVPAREACILALSKAIPEISSSCLTTLAGLAAMMFMKFRIGFDMGMVLIKAILLSIITVFTLMPGLLMLFSNLMDRSKHRNFIPNIEFWGKIVTRLKFLLTPCFIVILFIAYSLSGQCPFGYGFTLVESEKKSDVMIQQEAVQSVFGTQNIMAVLVPAGDYAQEGQLLHALEEMENVNTAVGLANVEVEDEDYVLTDQLTPRQFSELADMDIEVVRLLYTAYAADIEEYGRIINNIDNYSVPILDMFQFAYDRIEDGYVTFEAEDKADLDDMDTQINDARKQLQGTAYSRILLKVDLPEEGEETFAFMDTLHEVIEQYYPAGTFYVVGNSTSDYDLKSSFEKDNQLINILSILFVIVILLFTFQSVGLPILLILVIQGSIWINFAVPALQTKYIYFLSYLIVSSIQMGANIDYAIVISSRYQELKQTLPTRQAMIEALNQAFPTVLTSGSILSSAGVLIGKMTSDGAIYGVGDCIGRGTIISIFLVMAVLPGILLIGDAIVEHTSFNIHYPALIQTTSATGKVYLDGLVKGDIAGHINAEVHGFLEGDVTAVVNVKNKSPIRKSAPQTIAQPVASTAAPSVPPDGTANKPPEPVWEPSQQPASGWDATSDPNSDPNIDPNSAIHSDKEGNHHEG